MSRFVPGLTVVIPTIPPRNVERQRAYESVQRAVVHWNRVAAEPNAPVPEPAAFGRGGFGMGCIIEGDEAHAGAARTRHRGLEKVLTEWVAFLDDDDEFLPDHLVKLYAAAIEHEADFVWSRFRITYPDGSTLPGPAFLGEKAFSQWNDDDPCQTTITTLVRTELALEAGGFAQFEEDGREVDGHRRGEDHEFTLRCRKAGAAMRHVPEVTWLWHHWGIGQPGTPGNTSGLPDRW